MQGVSWHGLYVPALSRRVVLMLFSFSGLVWAAVWYWWFRNDPEQHGQVNAAELAYIAAGRTSGAPARGSQAGRNDGPHGWAFWRRLITHRGMIALCIMYLPNSFIFYFCITWFHHYLEQGRGLHGRTLDFFAGLPLLLSVAGDVLGGTTTDWAVRRYGHRWGLRRRGPRLVLVGRDIHLDGGRD